MRKPAKSGGWIYEKCLPLCVISPSSAVIHKSVFQKVGAFDEMLPACEDYDLWLRICAAYPVLYVEQPLLRKYASGSAVGEILGHGPVPGKGPGKNDERSSAVH